MKTGVKSGLTTCKTVIFVIYNTVFQSQSFITTNVFQLISKIGRTFDC